MVTSKPYFPQYDRFMQKFVVHGTKTGRMPRMPEVYFMPRFGDNGLEGFVTLVEPDFGFEPPTQEDAPLCEYCGKSKGYPSNLGIHVALLCDECAVFCGDEIVYDISQI